MGLSALEQLKLSLGDFESSSEMDEYYNSFISRASADLASDDIDAEVLKGDLGIAAVVLYAADLISQRSPADNKSLNLIRQRLTELTRGARYESIDKTY